MSPDGLFDPAHYLGEHSKAAAPPTDLSEALALDRVPTLLPGDDGLPARKVALHSLDKAHYARYYADIVGRAMQVAYPGPLAWVELFAGPGRLYVKDLNTFKTGSPIEALTIPKPFDYYVFADLDPRCTDALRQRVELARPGDVTVRVDVLDGDANDAALARPDPVDRSPERARGALRRSGRTRSELRHAALLRRALQAPRPVAQLPGPRCGARAAGRARGQGRQGAQPPGADRADRADLGQPGLSLRDWFQRQLGGLGYDQFAAEVVRLHGKNVALYDVMLASREEQAKKFFGEAVKRGPFGQYPMDLGC